MPGSGETVAVQLLAALADKNGRYCLGPVEPQNRIVACFHAPSD